MSNFEFAKFVMREINAFETYRKIASGSHCTIQRQCLRLIEDGTVHWAVLILASEHLWISAGSGILCSKAPAVGIEQDEECLLWPFKSCRRIVCRLTGESEEICATKYCDQHNLDFIDFFLIQKVKVDRMEEELIYEAKQCCDS